MLLKIVNLRKNMKNRIIKYNDQKQKITYLKNHFILKK